MLLFHVCFLSRVRIATKWLIHVKQSKSTLRLYIHPFLAMVEHVRPKYNKVYSLTEMHVWVLKNLKYWGPH